MRLAPVIYVFLETGSSYKMKMFSIGWLHIRIVYLSHRHIRYQVRLRIHVIVSALTSLNTKPTFLAIEFHRHTNMHSHTQQTFRQLSVLVDHRLRHFTRNFSQCSSTDMEFVSDFFFCTCIRMRIRAR